MSTSVSFNSVSYTVPATGEEDWGGSSKVDGLLISLANNALAKSGGTFTLTAEVDFGGTAGLKALSYKSRGSNIGTTGVLRLANAESVVWRNAANSADIALTVNASDQLVYNGNVILSSSGVLDADSGGTGQSSYSTGDTLYASGASALSKLAIGSANLVYLSTGSAPSWGQIVDASVSASAAVTRSKLASGTADHVLINNGSGVMSSEATLAKSRGGTGADNSSVTFPSSGTIATIAGTQVLTNKDIDGGTAANTSRITFPKDTLSAITALTRKEGTVWYASDTDKLYKDDGTSLTEIGSGSGGSINYISNPDAESGTTGWAAYADAAGTSPVDGTGGAPTVTITRTTTTPLRGTGSFLITKDAANRQGEGVSYAFSCDSADKAKVLNVSFDYEIASGTFASGDSSDIRIWIYDVTNAVLIPVTPYTIQGGSGQHKFTGTFQTASNSTSYRLIFHVATTSASAWAFEFDNVVVGPQVQLYGAPIGDWTAFTPTGSWTTNTTYTGFHRRVGDSMEVFVKLALAGAPNTTTLTVNMPTGYTIDTAKLVSTTAASNPIGSATYIDTGGSNFYGHIAYSSTTAVAPRALDASSTYLGTQDVNQATPFTFGNTDTVQLHWLVPIAGWSSSVVMSNDTDTRVVALVATGDAASASSGNPIIFPTASYDTHNGYNASTGRYTVPVSGYYKIGGNVGVASGSTSVLVYVDAVNTIQCGGMSAAGEYTALSAIVKVNAGQIIDIRPNATFDANGASVLTIERISGPSAIAASEKIYLQYTGNGGTSLTANTTNIDFSTKVVDSHGSWNGTVFTAPRASMYVIEGNWFTTANVGIDTDLYKSGSMILELSSDYATATSHMFSGSIYLLAGETISIRSSGAATLSNSATDHWISIYSQG